MTRAAEKVAVQVHRKVVRLDGARTNYGVVVNAEDFSVDETATEELRKKMTSERPKEYDSLSYNRGGPIEELAKVCEEEIGLLGLKPLWESEPYGPHVALPYVKEWYVKMRETKGWVLDDIHKL